MHSGVLDFVADNIYLLHRPSIAPKIKAQDNPKISFKKLQRHQEPVKTAS